MLRAAGHATIGTAALRAGELVLDLPDGFEFERVSDMYNGINRDSTECETPEPRPLLPRNLTVDEAVKQNEEGRVFIGAAPQCAGAARTGTRPCLAHRRDVPSPSQGGQVVVRCLPPGVPFRMVQSTSAAHANGAPQVRAVCQLPF